MRFLRRESAMVFLVLLTGAVGASEPIDATPSRQMLFHSGDDGYPRYRIPALAVAPNGDLLAFCEGRVDGGGFTGDIDLVLKRSTDNGRTWSPLQTIVDQQGDTCGYPSPVVDAKTKTIFVAFTLSRGDDLEREITAGTSRGTTRVMVVSSRDNGVTWSPPRDISATAKRADWTWYGFGSSSGVQLQSGRLVIPAYHVVARSEVYRSHMLFSDDHGKTWQAGEGVADGCGECQAAERRDGALYVNARNHAGKNVRVTRLSRDGGRTWANAEPAAQSLYDPICQADVYSLPSARAAKKPLWLFSHPAGPGRQNLTIRVSRDEGKTWSSGRLLQEDNAQYSSLAELPDGKIGCLYDRWDDGNYQILFARFSQAWLLHEKTLE